MTSKTLIEHWNGRAWKRVPSPSPAGSHGGDSSTLAAVAAARPSSAWAVGSYSRPGTYSKTLVMHWDGRAWKQVPSPDPGRSGSSLNAVAITQSDGAWAVGDAGGATVDHALIERWNGRAWKQVASPRPPRSRGSLLEGVTAAGSSNAWAVGYYFGESHVEPAVKTLIEHWNGQAWKQVASPSPGGSVGTSGDQSLLEATSATSSSSAWATGDYSTGKPTGNTLLEHWTGRQWTAVAAH